MALAAMARNNEELKTAQYRLLEMWQKTYQGELLILLPDTFGSTQFFNNAPDWVADWTGQRADSKDPFVAGDEYIAWLEKRGRDPRQQLFIASDGLDAATILALHAHFSGKIHDGYTPSDFRQAGDFLDEKKWTPGRRIRFSAGWGTLLTNDFRNCNPNGGADFNPLSLVCKLNDADGRPAVKLSDNFQKALGPRAEIERYQRVFGLAGVAEAPVLTYRKRRFLFPLLPFANPNELFHHSRSSAILPSLRYVTFQSPFCKTSLLSVCGCCVRPLGRTMRPEPQSIPRKSYLGGFQCRTPDVSVPW